MATTEVKIPLIYSKIATIRKEMPTLEKNGVGPSAQGGYKFLSIDDILKAVVPLENKHGVISFPIENKTDFHYNHGELPAGGRAAVQSVQGLSYFVFRYVAVEDGSYIDVPVTGEGIDNQDKATRKATTQAQKIANILTYNLITGEPDPDSQNGGGDNSASAPVPAAVAKAQGAAKSRPARPERPGASVPEEMPSREILKGYIDDGTLDQTDLSKMVTAKRLAAKPARSLTTEADYAAVLAELKAEGKI